MEEIFKILIGLMILVAISVIGLLICMLFDEFGIWVIPVIILSWLVGHIYTKISDKKTKENDDKL